MKKTVYEKVVEKILKQHKVTQKEHDSILKKMDYFMQEIRHALQKENVNAYVMLGGSAAKGTFVKNDFDCDIFVRFLYDEYKEQNISESMEKVLKKVPKIEYERVHGSRDYFQGVWKGLHYEVIPVLYVIKPWMAKNITDMSPLHVEWLNRRLTKELRDEILLMKLFCKAQKVYGAESYMHGFSGHVVDLLTIYYGSFKTLLENAELWEEKHVINMTPQPIDLLKDLNEDKLQSPLIIIDPVQPNRNAAAALGYEQFYHFKNQAKAFLQKSSTSFFKRKSVALATVKKRRKSIQKKRQCMLILKAMPTHGKLDTIGTKILKALEKIAQTFQHEEFTVLETNWDWEEMPKKPAILWLIIKEQKLSKKKEHIGPPLKMRKDVEAFQKKHKKTLFKEERIFAEVERKWTTPEALLSALLKRKDIKEKAKKWTAVKA